jgi:hypothetical protein
MRSLKVSFVVPALAVALAAVPYRAAAQAPAPTTMDQVVDRIATRESEVVSAIRQYSPMVETYIQNLKGDKVLGTVPNGDKYFLGRAALGNGVRLHMISDKESRGLKHKVFGSFTTLFTFDVHYMPDGFLQMIYLDTEGFNQQTYKFDYVRREFLGEVRCLVFDVTPQPKTGRGRFLGRIWVEDQNYTTVRFNGTYTGSTTRNVFFHFDSWRVNTGPNLWLPAFVYSEESDKNTAVVKQLHFKAQTRLWGYNLSQAGRESELGRILVEAPTPITDDSQAARDLSPVQSQRAWDRQAEDNVVERMERIGLLAPHGEMDKILETEVNNLEVTNNLDIQPEIRCRILLTSTLEAFTLGHTLVLSRGLIDTLPDEASLATMVAYEMAHIVLGHKMDTQFAFNDRLLFKDEETFQHFIFGRTKEEDAAANAKAIELMQNSPFKDQLGTASAFLAALNKRSKEIPNLISPHLGDRVPGNWSVASNSAPAATPPAQGSALTDGKDPKPTAVAQLVALPLGSRLKVDPWSDRIEVLKSKPAGYISDREKMPFEVTPLMPYLVRLPGTGPQPGSSLALKDKQDDPPPPKKPDQQ